MTATDIAEFLLAPGESQAVELKAWLNPESEDDRGKIAKELMALRNFGGGTLVIGIDDKKLAPSGRDPPDNPQVVFHKDVVQKIVKDYIQPTFEIDLKFGVSGGMLIPFIEVPPGVEFPVIARRQGPGIRQYAVYMRSVNNSGVVESTEPRSAEDWQAVISVCFDNREADVARFFRRNLPEIAKQLKQIPEAVDPVLSIMTTGAESFRNYVRKP